MSKSSNRRGLRALGIALALLAGTAASAGVPPAARSATPVAGTTLRVGRLTLRPCHAVAWCGELPRPLDPSGGIAGTIPVYFEYYPHSRAGAPSGTLVAAEGGPGYPTTDSRDEYLTLFAPLRESYDVLLMDYRGTGRSGAIDCKELQRAPKLTEAGIGECGRSLGRSAPLYSTALAADDLAALLEALGRERIGLYGDSYGTYFAQVFALRHPERLRALVLDGAYPLSGPDYGWYPNIAPAMRRKFDVACERAPGCRAIPGSSMEHIAPALEQLRAHPFEARVPQGDGRVIDFTADASALAILMYGGYPAYPTVREADAAARAFASGDQLPLLRLMAETLASVESRDPTGDPVKFSAGLAAAVSCQDPPHIFDMHLPPTDRAASRDRIIAERKASAPDTYAPFTIDEYRRMPLDFAYIDQCVLWPAAGPGSSPLTFEGVRYPAVPVLIISGELDDQTSVADGEAAAARYPHSRHIIIANSFHVNALPHARSECAAGLVRRFLADLEASDASCAAAVPPVPLVPRFARHVQELDPAAAIQGNEAGDQALRAVRAALLTCEDVITRAAENGAGDGVGLRGGTFTASKLGEGYRLMLRGVRWTEDLAVSGRIDWPGRSGAVHARLALDSPQASGALQLSWAEGANPSRVSATGRLADKDVAAELAR
ncbi:MAG: alpha/beta fold hydrolase [Gammaproteobacteria bacterium]|nr:alpha/beta fold hydrolase [Gammaproteobacteria bacterium]